MTHFLTPYSGSSIEELKDFLADSVSRLLEADNRQFKAMLDAIGYSPSDLAGRSWVGLNFGRFDLRGLDFSESDMRGCKFNGARIEGANFDGCKLDPKALETTLDFDLYTATERSGAAERRNFDWDRSTELAGHSSDVVSAFVLDNNSIVSWGDGDSALYVWSSEGRLRTKLRGHTAAVIGACPWADGQVISWGKDGRVILWPAQGGAHRVLAAHGASIRIFEQFEQSRFLVISKGGRAEIFDGSGGLKWRLGRLELTQLGGYIAGGKVLSEKEFCLWSERGEITVYSLIDDQSAIQSRQVSVDPNAAVCAFSHGEILYRREGHLVLVENSGEKTQLHWKSGLKRRVQLSEHHRSIVLADGRLYAWDESGETWRPENCDVLGKPSRIEFSSDRWNRGLDSVVFQDGGFITLSPLEVYSRSGRPQGKASDPPSRLLGALELPDGDVITWGAWGSQLDLWSERLEHKRQLSGHGGPVLGATLLRDGRLLSWSADKTLRLWG